MLCHPNEWIRCEDTVQHFANQTQAGLAAPVGDGAALDPARDVCAALGVAVALGVVGGGGAALGVVVVLGVVGGGGAALGVVVALGVVGGGGAALDPARDVCAADVVQLSVATRDVQGHGSDAASGEEE